MARSGLKKVVKTVRGGTRRTYYVRSNPRPQNLKAHKATGGVSAASRGAKIGAFAGAIIGGTMGTVGGSLLGGAASHSVLKSAIRAHDPWAGVGGNDPRLHLARHRPAMVAGHYAGGVARGAGAGGVLGAGAGAATGALIGAGIGKLVSRTQRSRSGGLRQNQSPQGSGGAPYGANWVGWSDRPRSTPPNKNRQNTATEDRLIREQRERSKRR